MTYAARGRKTGDLCKKTKKVRLSRKFILNMPFGLCYDKLYIFAEKAVCANGTAKASQTNV